MKEKLKVVSLVFRTFYSDRNPKATKHVNVHLFILSSNLYNLKRRIPGIFEATAYIAESQTAEQFGTVRKRATEKV
jgi:hypothetical protein